MTTTTSTAYIDKIKNDLDEELEYAIEDIILNYLRPIKLQMYECSANCCTDDAKEPEMVECLNECYGNTASANYCITGTLNDFKRRVRTCIRKCDNGSGYNPQEDDNEGSNEGIAEEDLDEKDDPGCEPENDILESVFDEITSDLEHDVKEDPTPKLDYKDKNVCTQMCVESYINTLAGVMEQMRRDLAALFLAKKPEQLWYYEWSRVQTAEQI